jgi:hypothetical protein
MLRTASVTRFLVAALDNRFGAAPECGRTFGVQLDQTEVLAPSAGFRQIFSQVGDAARRRPTLVPSAPGTLNESWRALPLLASSFFSTCRLEQQIRVRDEHVALEPLAGEPE